jgi:hypothetical protein
MTRETEDLKEMNERMIRLETAMLLNTHILEEIKKKRDELGMSHLSTKIALLEQKVSLVQWV